MKTVIGPLLGTPVWGAPFRGSPFGSLLSRSAAVAYAVALDYKAGSHTIGETTVSNEALLPGRTYSRSGPKAELNASSGLTSFAANVPGIVPEVGYWARQPFTNSITNNSDVMLGLNSATVTSLGAGSGLLGGVASRIMFSTNALSGGYLTTAAYSAGQTHTVSSFVRGVGSDIGKTVRIGVTRSETFYGQDVVLTGEWQQIKHTFTWATSNTFYYAAVVKGAINPAGTADACLIQSVISPISGPVIVTSGAAVTVGADGLRVDGAIPADEDQMFIVVADIKAGAGLGASTQQTFLSINAASGNNNIMIYKDGTTGLRSYVSSGGTYAFAPAHLGGNVIGRTVAILRKVGTTWSLAYRNGTTSEIGAGITSAWPATALTRFDVGQQVGGSAANAPIEFIGRRIGTFTDAQVLAELGRWV